MKKKSWPFCPFSRYLSQSIFIISVLKNTIAQRCHRGLPKGVFLRGPRGPEKHPDSQRTTPEWWDERQTAGRSIDIGYFEQGIDTLNGDRIGGNGKLENC